MHKSVQGMEARNRWKLLENSTPDHDISQLKVSALLLLFPRAKIVYCVLYTTPHSGGEEEGKG